MNYIDKIRNENRQYVNSANEISGSYEVIYSPDKHFTIKTKSFKQNHSDTNQEVTKVEVFKTEKAELLFTFFVNEGTFFHSWIKKAGIDYLLCAEDLCGGQTVIDLTNKKMSSYTTDNDGFIWTKHLLSPDERFLAVFGCHWGSSFFIIVYYFDNPMELPLKIAYEPGWTGYDIVEWIDNANLKVKNSEFDEAILKL